ncbi:MAG: S-methyl-5'-thioadenosine phosphorylase [Phycisphaerae bacterium]
MQNIKVGLIGGSGLGQALLSTASGEEYYPQTPFGRPSSPIICTQWEGIDIAVLARHGVGHTFSPSYIPFQANIFALKKLGVTHIIASGAAGSLREDVHPGDLVIPDQIIDKTHKRETSFFGKGIVVHVEFDQPFCGNLRKVLLDAGKNLSQPITVHDGGTYICMEGPQFSSMAESQMHRSWGGTVIGMTAMPEAKLAREAEICYSLIAMPTDYDCWKPRPAGRAKCDVLSEIISNMNKATELAIKLIKKALALMPKMVDPECHCQKSLELGIWTDRTKIAPATVRELEPLVGKYLGFAPKC